MKAILIFNPLSQGGKKYGFIIRGDTTKQELKNSIELIVSSRVRITSLNRKGFRQFYVNTSLIQEDRLREYWKIMKKELIKDNFSPEALEKEKEDFIRNR